jgi:purine-binding chemotaxis protein CheW
MRNSEPTVTDQGRVTLGCFEVGSRIFAIDVSQVREVVRWQPITPLPHAPELIDGVIDLRGSVVPVINLGRALGGEPTQPGLRSRIAVTEVEGLVVGLAVDAATEVIPVELAEMEAPPALAIRAGYETARAVVRRPDGEPIPVLSLENLLERVSRSTPAGEASP